MRKITLCITLLLITAVFYSCSESQKPDVPVSGERTITIKVAADAADTKASYIYDDIPYRIGHMAWDNGDQIGIFEKQPVNTSLIGGLGFDSYVAGLPNQNVPFTARPGAGGSTLTEFTGVVTNPENAVYFAYYPYSLDMHLFTYDMEGMEILLFNFPFPYNQTYIADSFDGIPAFARYDCSINNEELSDALFTFTNLCNILRFRVKLPLGSLGIHYLDRIEIRLGTPPSSLTIPSSVSMLYIDGIVAGSANGAIVNGMPTNLTDQDAITYEIGGGHLLSDSPGAYYHIALPTPIYNEFVPSPYSAGVMTFVMSNGDRHEQSVDFSLLTPSINRIYTVPDLILDNNIK